MNPLQHKLQQGSVAFSVQREMPIQGILLYFNLQSPLRMILLTAGPFLHQQLFVTCGLLSQAGRPCWLAVGKGRD